jgi:intracellular sulfur oxidation DsrE/DsrF family protein
VRGNCSGGSGNYDCNLERYRAELTSMQTAGMKKIACSIALFIGLLPLVAAHADPDLVVAGRQKTLEQAVNAPHAPNYRLLILRRELMRVRASRAEEEVRALIERARRDGAVVFVCEKDLKAERLQSADLLPGIVSVDASDIWVSGAPTDADLRLRSFCS